MHVSELDKSETQGKRTSSKGKISVVFLAPYWSSVSGLVGKGGAGGFSNYPLLELDSIDVSPSTIQKYPHAGSRGLNIHQLRVAFRFTGLPKYAFPRFVDSHRFALALKTYAQNEIQAATLADATAALFDTHPLAIQTARYPRALLHLPFEHILAKLPPVGDEKSASFYEEDDKVEPVVQLAQIMKSMEPPRCWGQAPDEGSIAVSPQKKSDAPMHLIASPQAVLPGKTADGDRQNGFAPVRLNDFASELLLDELSGLEGSDISSASLKGDLGRYISRLCTMIPRLENLEADQTQARVASLLLECLRMKVREY
jgi:hypothetical protein